MDVLKEALRAVAIGLVQHGDSGSSHCESPSSCYSEHGARLGCPYVKRAEIALGAKL